MPTDLTRYAWISVVAALATIGLKGGAWLLTGSVGLFSDAVESLVNLLAAVAALTALAVAAQPPDEEHAYGHTKAEYFSSGFEGALVLVAAAGVLYAGAVRLLDPQPVEHAPIGLAIAGVASIINLLVARHLLRAARTHGSVALEADARHLMADVWTSGGVIGGVGVAAITGWHILDPLMALVVGANVMRMGVPLIRRSMLGLLDTALSDEERAEVLAALDSFHDRGIRFHALRTRRAGRWRFVSFHVLVPGSWTVQKGHDLLEEIEEDIRVRLPGTTVFTHLEPLEDPLSWTDIGLAPDREPAPDRDPAPTDPHRRRPNRP